MDSYDLSLPRESNDVQQEQLNCFLSNDLRTQTGALCEQSRGGKQMGERFQEEGYMDTLWLRCMMGRNQYDIINNYH